MRSSRSAKKAGLLTELFTGASVVCNIVGPRSARTDRRWWRRLAAGCHDLDATGDRDWVLAAKWQRDAWFAKRELPLASGAQMYTSSEIAASMVSRIVISFVMRGALTLSDGPDLPTGFTAPGDRVLATVSHLRRPHSVAHPLADAT